MRWPWIALRATPTSSDIPTRNLSKHIQKAQSYLKNQFPDAFIPESILKESLRDALADVSDYLTLAQGELLALGMTRYTRVGGVGKQVHGQWKRFCIAFPSGELRNNIGNPETRTRLKSGIALIRWCTTTDNSETQSRVPFLTEKSKNDVPFEQQIQQIVFHTPLELEDLSGPVIPSSF